LEDFNLNHYKSIKTALKELGFTVDYVEKQAQKTVITVSHYENGNKTPVFGEKQANSHKEVR